MSRVDTTTTAPFVANGSSTAARRTFVSAASSSQRAPRSSARLLIPACVGGPTTSLTSSPSGKAVARTALCLGVSRKVTRLTVTSSGRSHSTSSRGRRTSSGFPRFFERLSSNLARNRLPRRTCRTKTPPCVALFASSARRNLKPKRKGEACCSPKWPPTTTTSGTSCSPMRLSWFCPRSHLSVLDNLTRWRPLLEPRTSELLLESWIRQLLRL